VRRSLYGVLAVALGSSGVARAAPAAPDRDGNHVQRAWLEPGAPGEGRHRTVRADDDVTFAYELGCRGVIQPNAYKLLVVEDGTKYIFRGFTRLRDDNPDGTSGTFAATPAGERWPKALLAHAQARRRETDGDKAF
jgi:hypothetical protein